MRKENRYIRGLFITILAVSMYLKFFHFEQGTFEEMTNTSFIVTCILLIYAIYFVIFLFTNTPYSISAPKYSFNFFANFLLLWGTPVILGYFLAHSIATYYTGTYGKLAPVSIAQITYKGKTSSGKKGSYYLYLSNNLLPALSVDKENYEKAMINQCIEVQYRTSFIGIYRDSWKFVKCPNEFPQHL